ncbi:MULTISPECIES: glycosyltransferase family 9 protein [unclassified Helicobacter]|uniref:glycosyltransferase family 9 protein n=1 Tax=unclassified Helicobacter TaxID=2593540 RepID=UPI00115F89D4|nr:MULTISPECIES: glycosyltransferase family 9 protein [unclassified Helicobacter]
MEREGLKMVESSGVESSCASGVESRRDAESSDSVDSGGIVGGLRANDLKILLRLPNWLGDGVMSTPTIELLKTLFPQARIYLIAPRAILELFAMDSGIAGRFEDDTKRAKCRLLATIKLGRKIRASIGACDIAITLTNHFYSALLLRASGARRRIGYVKGLGGLLLSDTLKREKRVHQVLSYAYLLAPLVDSGEFKKGVDFGEFKKGVDSGEFDKGADLDSGDSFASARAWIDKTIGGLHLAVDSSSANVASRANIAHKALRVGLNPAAAYGDAKRWLPSYFAATAAHFAGLGAEVLIFGTKGDSELAESIISEARAILDSSAKSQVGSKKDSQTESKIDSAKSRAKSTPESSARESHIIGTGTLINRCGQTDIKGLICEINALDIFISNDSGPMHIAAALGVVTIGIFGPTDASETMAWRADNFALISANLPCAPCKKRTCPLKHHDCMKRVTPEMVINLAKDKLGRR